MTENTRTVLRLKRATVNKVTAPGHVTASPAQTTEKAGNKQHRKNRKKLERLVSLWPDAFNLENPRPLAIGIDKALATDIERRQLSGAGSLRFSLGLYIHPFCLHQSAGRWWATLRPEWQASGGRYRRTAGACQSTAQAENSPAY
ncbi:ProQ/FINO family protein [Pectobacterium zantedeschiae]|nr:ProQ/FINO family protein [Pectobacterium zantedeschiae]